MKPETLENATEGSQWEDDWLQEVQNQPEPTPSPSQMETLAAEFEIFQPLEEGAEMHTKQPEETISHKH